MRAELKVVALTRAEPPNRVNGDEDLADAVSVVARRPQSDFRAQVVSDGGDDARDVGGDRAVAAGAGACLADFEVDDGDCFGAFFFDFYYVMVSQ